MELFIYSAMTFILGVLIGRRGVAAYRDYIKFLDNIWEERIARVDALAVELTTEIDRVRQGVDAAETILGIAEKVSDTKIVFRHRPPYVPSGVTLWVDTSTPYWTTWRLSAEGSAVKKVKLGNIRGEDGDVGEAGFTLVLTPEAGGIAVEPEVLTTPYRDASPEEMTAPDTESPRRARVIDLS